MRHREGVRRPRLEQQPRRRDLDRVQDRPRRPPRPQQPDQRLDEVRLVAPQDRVDQRLRLRLRDRRRVGEQAAVGAGRHRRRQRRLGRLLLELVQHDLAGRLEARIPARAHRQVRHRRVDHVVRVLPADRPPQLDQRPLPVRLVPRRVRPVPDHPVLHVHQPGEHRVRQQLLAPPPQLPQPQPQPVRLVHPAPLDQPLPALHFLLEVALQRRRLLVLPVHDRHRRAVGVRRWVVRAPCVVPRHLAQQLVPDVERAGHVPRGLRQRQVPQRVRHQVLQRQRRPRAQQRVVVVDEAHEAAVHALVVGHVRVGRVDAHRLAEDLRRGRPFWIRSNVTALAPAESRSITRSRNCSYLPAVSRSVIDGESAMAAVLPARPGRRRPQNSRIARPLIRPAASAWVASLISSIP